MQSIQKQLDAIDREFKHLDSKRTKLLSKPRDLVASLKNLPKNVSLTPRQKVEFFGFLFKGRQDIHAKKWKNKKEVTGFSVACGNEWKPAICEKPRIKCGDCPNKLFTEVNDRILFDHLSGNTSQFACIFLTTSDTYHMVNQCGDRIWGSGDFPLQKDIILCRPHQ